ncbi:sulfotransferase [Verrucomicrobia bacterium]|nr:sulfotransferase [Verrucomicrobiota bacterium]
MSEKSAELEEFRDFFKKVRPLYLIDHAGRAGNGFFQTLFDEHPEVLSIPWIHYCTSYFITEFGDTEEVDSRKAQAFWTKTSYFRFFYHELSDADHELVYRFGGNPETAIDRRKVRAIFDQLILSKDSVSAKEVIFASYFAIAKALGRKMEEIKFLILTDSISLRTENVFSGFSGRVIEHAIKDSPNAKFIHLVRDPRAGFASSNHQFVNQLGNMYALDSFHIFAKVKDLIDCRLSMSGPFVFAFWILYFIQTFRAIENKKSQKPGLFLTVWNEDLNLRFKPTMKKLSQNLQISYNANWDQPDYLPTMLGHEWKGTGGYSNRYQTKNSGPLQNDPDEISSKVTGPNSYVTERWKKRLSKNELYLLEYFFRHEIETYGYDFTSDAPLINNEASIWMRMLFPLQGEIPHLNWLLHGFRQSPTEFAKRLTYYLVLPIFYPLGRLVFLMNKRTRRILFDGPLNS